MGPALLVLLLGVRVATAAAVECQHALADAARAAERAQEARLVEVLALGGELCLYATGAPSETAQQDGAPHLTSPCPFFKSPIALPVIVNDATARIVSFSRLVPVFGLRVANAQAPRAAYSPRAPPQGGLG